MMTRGAIVVLLASALVAGCGGESHQDLRAWMADQGKNAKGRLDPLPQIRPYEPFAYNAYDLPDPFKPRKIEPMKGSNRLAPDLARRREPLEAYPLESLTMVGTLEKAKGVFALVRTPVRVYPVGRLDWDSSGLLLLTNDGELKRRLELPRTGVVRTYRARAHGQVTQAQLEELADGITVEGMHYGSINANLERRTGSNCWIEMSLTEGKNREVRRVLEHLGLQVSRLIRIAYGPLTLEGLEPGDADEVSQSEFEAFTKSLK